jgi:hypothetical protein
MLGNFISGGAGGSGGTSSSSGWKTVTTTTITAATDTITFSGLDLLTDQIYKIFVNAKCSLGSTQIGLYYNDDTTNANYQGQYLFWQGAGAPGAFAFNTAEIMECPDADGTVIGEITIMQKNFPQDYPRAICHMNYDYTGTVAAQTNHTKWTNTANVTSIKIKTFAGQQFAVGSRFILQKKI